MLYFFIGNLIGATIGGSIIEFTESVIEFILGIFILLTCWAPINFKFESKKRLTILGVITSFLTMFIGATGPFVIATVRKIIPEKQEVIATSAALLTIQHLLKAIVFGLFGFAFSDWIGLIACMILVGAVHLSAMSY